MSPGQWRARNEFPAVEVPSLLSEEGWGAGGGRGGGRRDDRRTCGEVLRLKKEAAGQTVGGAGRREPGCDRPGNVGRAELLAGLELRHPPPRSVRPRSPGGAASASGEGRGVPSSLALGRGSSAALKGSQGEG